MPQLRLFNFQFISSRQPDSHSCSACSQPCARENTKVESDTNLTAMEAHMTLPGINLEEGLDYDCTVAPPSPSSAESALLLGSGNTEKSAGACCLAPRPSASPTSSVEVAGQDLEPVEQDTEDMSDPSRLKRRKSVGDLRVASIMWENLYTGPLTAPRSSGVSTEQGAGPGNPGTLAIQVAPQLPPRPPRHARRPRLSRRPTGRQPNGAPAPLSPVEELAEMQSQSSLRSLSPALQWSPKSFTTSATSEESAMARGSPDDDKNMLGLAGIQQEDEEEDADPAESLEGQPLSLVREESVAQDVRLPILSSTLQKRRSGDSTGHAEASRDAKGLDEIGRRSSSRSRQGHVKKERVLRPVFVYGDLADPLLLSVILSGSPDTSTKVERQPARLHGYEGRILQPYNYPVIVKQISPSSDSLPSSSPLSYSINAETSFVDGILLYSLTSLQRKRIKRFYPTFLSQDAPHLDVTHDSHSPKISTPTGPLFKRTKVDVTLNDRAEDFGYDIQADVYLVTGPSISNDEGPPDGETATAYLTLAKGEWDSNQFKAQSLDTYLAVF